MRVKLTTCLAGVDVTYSAGDVAEFPDDEAERLVVAGFAVPVAEFATIENAMASPSAETAMVNAAPAAPKRRASKKS